MQYRRIFFSIRLRNQSIRIIRINRPHTGPQALPRLKWSMQVQPQISWNRRRDYRSIYLSIYLSIYIYICVCVARSIYIYKWVAT
jgi:hypothetical protein